MRTLLVTGSSGLIGSEMCSYFAAQGWRIHGLDNNQRAVFFGPPGDTRWNQQRLAATIRGFEHHETDLRDRAAVLALVEAVRPQAISTPTRPFTTSGCSCTTPTSRTPPPSAAS